jgi:hypothetical protein
MSFPELPRTCWSAGLKHPIYFDVHDILQICGLWFDFDGSPLLWVISGDRNILLSSLSERANYTVIKVASSRRPLIIAPGFLPGSSILGLSKIRREFKSFQVQEFSSIFPIL